MPTVAVALLSRVPKLQVTIPFDWAEVPCEFVALTNAAPGGSGSVSTTLVVVEGPRFLTRTV